MAYTQLQDFFNQSTQKQQISEALLSVVNTLAECCQAIQAKVRLGALSGVLGEAGTGNVQGEAQKKLDVIANQMLIDALKSNPAVAGLVHLRGRHRRGRDHFGRVG